MRMNMKAYSKMRKNPIGYAADRLIGLSGRYTDLVRVAMGSYPDKGLHKNIVKCRRKINFWRDRFEKLYKEKIYEKYGIPDKKLDRSGIRR